MTTIKLDDGKYEFDLDDQTGLMTAARRHGEPWMAGLEQRFSKSFMAALWRLRDLEAAGEPVAHFINDAAAGEPAHYAQVAKEFNGTPGTIALFAAGGAVQEPVAQYQTKLRNPILPEWDVWINVSEEGARVAREKYPEIYEVRELFERSAAAPQAAATVPLTDEQILALNAGEIYFSETPTKYPEAGHGTQYHCGAPGLLKFARALLREASSTTAGADAQSDMVKESQNVTTSAEHGHGMTMSASADAEDAARYRWLREHGEEVQQWGGEVWFPYDGKIAARLDNAVDAARKGDNK